MPMGVAIDRNALSDFCRRWQVKELALFGSVLRDDFHDDSDVDVLVTPTEGAQWGLFDLVAMQDDLSSVLGRRVDLMTKRSIEQSDNWIRRRSILNNAKTIYAA